MRSITLLFFVAFSFNAAAQSMDDLNTELKNAGDSAEAGRVISRMGNAWFQQANFVKASECFFQSLRIAEKYNDQLTVAANNNNLAATFMETENYPEAENYAKQNDPKGLANAYNSLANVYYMLEKDSLSLSYFEKSLLQRKIANDSAGLFKGYKNLGSIHFEMGDTVAGISYFRQSLNFISGAADTELWFGG